MTIDHRGGEQVDINPTRAATMELPVAHKRDHIVMRDGSSLVHQFVRGQEPHSAAPIADKKFTKHQFVTDDLVPLEEGVEFRSERLAVCQEANPNRGVDEDHQAARRLLGDRSRRLETSCAFGSEPFKDRRRS
jgi:hypothetical protein